MKKIMSIITLLFALMVNAQDVGKPVAATLNNQLSVRFSNLTGYGVGYQYNFLEDYAVRGTAWYRYYEYIKGPEAKPLNKDSNIDYNFGLDMQRNIFKEDKYRVFAFGGIGYVIREEMEQHKDTLSGNLVTRGNPVNRELLTYGAGIGLEYFFMKNLSADLGLSYKKDDEIDRKNDATEYDDERRRETVLGFLIGLNFNF